MKMRHFAMVLVSAALACGACVPLQNAPAGGGATVTSTYRLGPFTLAPGGEAQGTSTNIPRPTGQFGLQRASFTLVDEHGRRDCPDFEIAKRQRKQPGFTQAQAADVFDLFSAPLLGRDDADRDP